MGQLGCSDLTFPLIFYMQNVKIYSESISSIQNWVVKKFILISQLNDETIVVLLETEKRNIKKFN